VTASALPALEIERATTATRVAESLRRELLSGAYPLGTPIRDSELSQRAGVSRNTVREALSQLVGDGLLVHSLHRGVEVARVSQNDILDIYRLRRVLERAGLEEVLRAKEHDRLIGLEQAVEHMRIATANDDFAASVEADGLFHRALVDGLRIRRVTESAERAFLELRLVFAVLDRNHRDLARQLDDHVELLAVVTRRDRKRSRSLLEAHLGTSERLVRSELGSVLARETPH
jgi:DNA-binding GntR family transcriptional regulator